ncbi:ABC transporter ATP-binding protein [Candidatus Woesearchaeota archaeon]|nr:ABC transporter ATP-binding protein [Candidatus Woesearchaeota archaeon]
MPKKIVQKKHHSSEHSHHHLIELKKVWKTYLLGEIKLDVLKEINLELHKGEFIVIVGPSGSGKSTLMNLLGMLDVPTKGQLFLDEIDVSTLKESDLAQLRGKKIGFVFQQFNLIPTLTAIENVTLPAVFQGMPEKVRLEKAKNLLGLVGLSERMDHKPSELSGGQQQRVAIARALINDPEIILADEPTGNLDSHSGEQVMQMLTDLHENKQKTIILVTHDTELVKFSERTIHLKDGEVVKIENRKCKH